MVISSIIHNIVSSASEAECGLLFYNAKKVESLKATLKKMVHPQQSTEIVADNSTKDLIMRGTIK